MNRDHDVSQSPQLPPGFVNCGDYAISVSRIIPHTSNVRRFLRHLPVVRQRALNGHKDFLLPLEEMEAYYATLEEYTAIEREIAQEHDAETSLMVSLGEVSREPGAVPPEALIILSPSGLLANKAMSASVRVSRLRVMWLMLVIRLRKFRRQGTS